MKNKNAFTLIELLAIIVILAIIAVITVPIILNTIDKSKKGAKIDSAYGYSDALRKYYMSGMIDNKYGDLPTATYNISDLPSDFKVSGESPSEGWVELDEGEVVAYSLKFDEYVVTKDKDEDPVAVKNGTIGQTSEQKTISEKVDSYVKAALAANSSLTADTVKKVSEMSGVTTNAAESGWIQFEYKNSTLSVKDYSLKYGSSNANYSSLTDGNYISTFGSLRYIPITLGIKVGNVQYYTGGTTSEPDNAIYLDPINGIVNCTTYDASNSTTGYKGTGATGSQTTCLKWFIYSIDDKGTESEADDVVNMILDHNTTGGIVWHGSNNYTGPNSTFLTQLTNDTSAWISNKLISPSAYTASCTYSSTARTYTITYTTKARLIEADEVAKIKGDSSWTYKTSTSAITTNNYNFLKTNLSTSGSTNVAYWTSSPDAGNSFTAWLVFNDATLSYDHVGSTSRGIRPVVSISKIDAL